MHRVSVLSQTHQQLLKQHISCMITKIMEIHMLPSICVQELLNGLREPNLDKIWFSKPWSKVSRHPKVEGHLGSFDSALSFILEQLPLHVGRCLHPTPWPFSSLDFKRSLIISFILGRTLSYPSQDFQKLSTWGHDNYLNKIIKIFIMLHKTMHFKLNTRLLSYHVLFIIYLVVIWLNSYYNHKLQLLNHLL